MQEQVHQYRTDHSALRRTTLPWHLSAFRGLKRRCEPPLDIQQDPILLDVAVNRFHQEAMIDLIQSPFEVKFHHPVESPAPFSSDGNRLLGRPSRPISIRIRMEHRVQLRLDDLFDDGLRNPIRHSGDGQRELHLSTVRIWDGLKSAILSTHFEASASRS